MGIVKECTGCRSDVTDPLIMPENYEAYQVFLICHRQLLVGFGGAYAIDGKFVWQVLDDRGVPDKTKTFSRVDLMAAHYLEEKRKQQKK